MIAKKTNGPAVGAAWTIKKSQLPPGSNAKSTRTEAQRQRILTALHRRPHSTEDLRCLGIFQAATRIKELRDQFGFSITTSRITVVDREGYSHPRAALYSLQEPASPANIDFQAAGCKGGAA